MVRALTEIYLRNTAITDIGTKTRGLFLQVHHHLVAIHTIRVAWEILYDCSGGQLATWLNT